MLQHDNRPAPRDTVLFDIEMALRKGEKLWPKRYRPGDHDRLKPMATAILEHLELCGLRFFRKPPRRWHSTSDLQTGAPAGAKRDESGMDLPATPGPPVGKSPAAGHGTQEKTNGSPGRSCR